MSFRLLPFLVGLPDLAPPHPFAPSAFAALIAHTGCSFPWCRIRTLALLVQSTCGFSVCIDTEGSHVPWNRLSQNQATYIPDTAPPVNRLRRSCRSLSRRLLANRGFDIVWFFRHEKRWFTIVLLPGSQLTPYTSEPFCLHCLPPRLLSSGGSWFGAFSCKTTPKDLPSSTTQVRKTSRLSPTRFARGTPRK